MGNSPGWYGLFLKRNELSQIYWITNKVWLMCNQYHEYHTNETYPKGREGLKVETLKEYHLFIWIRVSEYWWLSWNIHPILSFLVNIQYSIARQFQSYFSNSSEAISLSSLFTVTKIMNFPRKFCTNIRLQERPKLLWIILTHKTSCHDFLSMPWY